MTFVLPEAQAIAIAAARIDDYIPEAMGPRGQEFFHELEGNLWTAYHACTAPHVGYPEGSRSLRIDPVDLVDGVSVIAGPMVDPQPLP